MKTCPACVCEKPASEFYKNRATKDGLTVYCKECDRERARKWRTSNPESTKRSKRKCDLKKKYGITPEEYDSMLKTQGGVCAICSTDKSGQLGGTFAVDHCHDTGKVRGLLCCNCNRGLGYFKDDLTLLDIAASYLRN